MANAQGANGASALVDFTATDSSTPLVFEDRLRAGGVTLVRCRASPTPAGARIVSPQTTVVVPAGAAFELDWQPPESDRVQSNTLRRGRAMLFEAEAPVWKRWHAAPSIFVVALDRAFVEEVRQTAFEASNGADLRSLIGVEDPVMDRLARLAERELRDGGAHGRLYTDSLATALAVHVLETYGADRQAAERRIGGLPPAQTRRVMDYVSAHLADDLGLADLAALTGLSPHHFGAAFKNAVGISPHQYVIEHRVERARDLLRHPDRTVAQVAFAVGFSSQSHLTTNFRRVMGVTPGQFRRSPA